MSETKPKYWMGDVPTHCDVTGRPITDRFVDGKVRGSSWANMHPDTHADLGCGLGTGRGQEYTLQPDGRWIKTGG